MVRNVFHIEYSLSDYGSGERPKLQFRYFPVLPLQIAKLLVMLASYS